MSLEKISDTNYTNDYLVCRNCNNNINKEDLYIVKDTECKCLRLYCNNCISYRTELIVPYYCKFCNKYLKFKKNNTKRLLYYIIDLGIEYLWKPIIIIIISYELSRFK
jgi:hypothetical protein